MSDRAKVECVDVSEELAPGDDDKALHRAEYVPGGEVSADVRILGEL